MNIDFNPVRATITIAKEEVNPVSLVLTQEYGEHHHFEITLDYDMYGDGFMSNPLKHIELIGRLVFIGFNYLNDSSDSYLFKGVVTHVKQTAKEGKKGYLIISGSSPTIMLEKGKRMDVYSDKTLYKITKQIAERAYSDYLSFVCEPVYQNKVDFLMQYNESDWDFLKRLAYLYRENFFYDGYELKFGTFSDSKTLNLTYDREIIDLEFCSKMLPSVIERYQYVSQTDNYIERKVPEKIENSNDYLDKAEEVSYTALNITDHSKTYMDTPLYARSELSQMLKREKSRNAAQRLTVKGKSKTFQTSIGQIINITIPEILSKTNNIGTYRVIKSIHRIDEKGRYGCEFKAIAASIDTTPIKEPKVSSADSVTGTIKSNQDPMNQGRVQVSFDFASTGSYAWLRVLTPNAGSSQVVSQNRGMVFIPEKGDQVMIGFEYGDPNRPYVMGSLFHGKNGKGGGQDNAEKSIITKSGIRIVFNDESRSLHIEDPSGNTWDMDGNGNINVTAPYQITFNSENIVFNASKDITSNAGNSVGIRAANLISTNSEVMSQFVNGQWALQANNSLLNTLNRMCIESSYMALASTQNMLFHCDDRMFVNSMNSLDMRATNSIQSSQDSQQHQYSQQIDACVVDFRPSADFDAQYGFDWFRVGDIGETPFESMLLMANILNGSTNRVTSVTRDEAKKALKDRVYHESFAIAGTGQTYYVPVLNFYTQGALSEFAHLTQEQRPVNVAKFRIFVTINKPIAYIQFTYDKSKFLVTPEILRDNQPCQKQLSQSGDITVTCIDPSSGFAQAQYISAWAMYDDNTPPQLVGNLKVSPNIPKLRKKHKVLIVPVATDINNSNTTPNIGRSNLLELNNIYKYLYQSFIEVDIELFEGYLDLTDDQNFQKRRSQENPNRFIYGKFIYHRGIDPLNTTEVTVDKTTDGNIYTGRREGNIYTIYPYLRKRFLRTKELQDRYNDHTIVYIFNERSYLYSYSEFQGADGYMYSKESFSEGDTEFYGAKNIIMYIRKNMGSMGHEVLHGLGLYHTFDLKPAWQNMYVFLESKTDNVMDYYNDRKHTYRWQWKIINEKLR